MPAVWQGLLACHCSLVAPVAAVVSPSPAGWPRRPTGAAPQPFGPHARPYEIPSICEGAWYILVYTRIYYTRIYRFNILVRYTSSDAEMPFPARKCPAPRARKLIVFQRKFPTPFHKGGVGQSIDHCIIDVHNDTNACATQRN